MLALLSVKNCKQKVVSVWVAILFRQVQSINMAHDGLFSMRMDVYNQFSQVPKSFQLQTVAVVHRHGDRSQIERGLGDTVVENEDITKFWKTKMPSPDRLKDLSKVALTNLPKILSKEFYDGLDFEKYPYGMLTEVGVQQLIEVGTQLRKMYIGTFLSENIIATEYALRSTSFCRTIHSVRALLVGLFNANSMEAMANPPFITVRPKEEETMYPQANGPCPAMGARRKELFANDYISKTWPGFHEMEHRFRELLKYNSTLNWLTIREILVCHYSHGLDLPQGLTLDDVGLLDRFAGWMWGSLYSDYKINRLAIGRFLGELADDIDQSVNRLTPAKMLIYSGHDSTIVPLACALGISDGTWPLYAAHIVIEIAKDDATGELYFRVINNAREMKLEHVGDAHHVFGEWYLYGNLLNLLRSFKPIDYMKECECEGVDDEALREEIRATTSGK